MTPATHQLDVRWELDGVEVSSGLGIVVDGGALPTGDHSVTVTASDPTSFVRPGLVRETRMCTVRVDRTSPTAALVDPADGASVSGSLSVTATASDDQGVLRVELWVDGAMSGSDPAAPFAFSWNTTVVKDGTHTVQVRAYDAAGNTGLSGLRTVTVANATSAPSLPEGWTDGDDGAVGLAGAAGHSAGRLR